MTTSRKPVENRDLWEKILAYLKDYDFRYYLVKGHVSTKASRETLKKNYEKFKGHNGDKFSFEDYLYITEKNNRVDELANIGMDEIR
jgi:ribonuclease HI